jgi:hypothetical protein
LAKLDGSLTENVDELEIMTNQFYSYLYMAEDTIGMEEVLSHIPTKVDCAMNAKLNEIL